MHDRAAVNYAAMRFVCVMYPNVGRFNHTLDNTGGKTPVEDEFLTAWI